jgi:hypothetical protein
MESFIPVLSGVLAFDDAEFLNRIGYAALSTDPFLFLADFQNEACIGNCPCLANHFGNFPWVDLGVKYFVELVTDLRNLFAKVRIFLGLELFFAAFDDLADVVNTHNFSSKVS